MVLDPSKLAPCIKTDRPQDDVWSSEPSMLLPSRLNLVSTSYMYLEQNVKHSSAMYASAMDPSGLALFLTYRFRVHSRLSIGYIHPYCTGPRRIASSGK